jgi:pimeloyl-ACP methyl ester carboxylesterase
LDKCKWRGQDEAMPDLRVLCLHGYHGTGAIMRRQMAALARSLPADIEFVYVDAPSLASGGFGWWHEGFSGWARTRDWITGQLSTGPRIDGLFGFSQGAALTGLLAALRESPQAPPGLDFGFAIMVGGFTSFLPQHADLFPRPLTIPSVHVTGRSDGIVPRSDSLKLAGRFAGPLVLEHGGGHVIPGERAVAEPIARFLARFASAQTGAAHEGTRNGL